MYLQHLKVLSSTSKYVSTATIVNTCIYTPSCTVTHKHIHKRSNKQLSFVQIMYKIVYMAAEPSVEKVQINYVRMWQLSQNFRKVHHIYEAAWPRVKKL